MATADKLPLHTFMPTFVSYVTDEISKHGAPRSFGGEPEHSNRLPTKWTRKPREKPSEQPAEWQCTKRKFEMDCTPKTCAFSSIDTRKRRTDRQNRHGETVRIYGLTVWCISLLIIVKPWVRKQIDRQQEFLSIGASPSDIVALIWSTLSSFGMGFPGVFKFLIIPESGCLAWTPSICSHVQSLCVHLWISVVEHC